MRARSFILIESIQARVVLTIAFTIFRDPRIDRHARRLLAAEAQIILEREMSKKPQRRPGTDWRPDAISSPPWLVVTALRPKADQGQAFA
jgi:hypothetical protein